MIKLAQFTTELFRHLGEETGQDTGFKQNSSTSIAAAQERNEELLQGFGLEVEVVSIKDSSGYVADDVC